MRGVRSILVAAFVTGLMGCDDPKICVSTDQTKYRIAYPALELGQPRIERVQRYACADGTDEWVEIGRSAREMSRAY